MDEQRRQVLSTMPYKEYLQTPEWAQKRALVLQRDAHRCRLCDSSEALQIHHRTYRRRGNEDLNDLTTLCQACHAQFHCKTMVPETKEECLMGMLLQAPALFPVVSAYLSESDFVGTETQALYRLFALSEQPRLPLSLLPAATRAIEVAKPRFVKDQEEQKKRAIQLAMRMNVLQREQSTGE